MILYSTENLLDKYKEIAYEAYFKFEDISDYVYKSQRLIEHETKSEIAKPDDYFPNDESMRELRWKLESTKLKNVFPDLISSGNLFNVLSILETYLMILALELEKNLNKQLLSSKGNGINRIFNFLRYLGINLEEKKYYHQINAAIKIRNCLLHANGMLAWSKDVIELKRIQQSVIYLSHDHRDNEKYNKISIVNSVIGERIQIDNNYPFILCFYATEFIVDLCKSASELSSA